MNISILLSLLGSISVSFDIIITLLRCLFWWFFCLNHEFMLSDTRYFLSLNCSHARGVSAPGPSFGILELMCYHRNSLCHICIPLKWRHNELDGVSNHQPHDCLLNRLFRRRSKKSSKLRFTGLCVGNSRGTGEFPTQRASNAENVSIWWRPHAQLGYSTGTAYRLCNQFSLWYLVSRISHLLPVGLNNFWKTSF